MNIEGYIYWLFSHNSIIKFSINSCSIKELILNCVIFLVKCSSKTAIVFSCSFHCALWGKNKGLIWGQSDANFKGTSCLSVVIYCKGNFSGTRQAWKQSTLAQVSLTLSECRLCCICKSDLWSKRGLRALKGSVCMSVLLILHHSHSPAD